MAVVSDPDCYRVLFMSRAILDSGLTRTIRYELELDPTNSSDDAFIFFSNILMSVASIF